MKKSIKTLFIIAAIAASTLTASARTSYRGFAEVDPAISISYSQPNKLDLKFADSFATASALISTTHGVQLNRSIFVGAGVGINIIDDESFFFPIYAAARWELNITSKVTPFVSCKLGVCFGSRDATHNNHFITSSGEDLWMDPYSRYSFFYYQPTVGVRFRLHHHIGLNVGFTLIPTSYEIRGGYDEEQYEGATFNCLNLGLNIGLDF